MAIPDTRDIAITRAATTTTTAVIHLTERLTTVDGRTIIGAIELTNIISIITTATKRVVHVRVNRLAWSNSKPAFFLREAELFPVKG